MKISTSKLLWIAISIVVSFSSCTETASNEHQKTGAESSHLDNERQIIQTLEKHLNAVSNKDLASLKSTLSPEGKMQLILPGSEIISSVDSFMNYHEAWFQDTSWSFETKILNTETGNQMGLAITEIIYREPERDGEPYYNRMIVSYGLEKIEDEWYVIKDHASSIEKSTDKK